MRILITGGAGYLGSHLTEILLKNGYKVNILDNFSYGDNGIKHINSNDLNIINGDICNIKDVVKSIKNVDVVVALAAIVGDPACNLNDEDTLNTNYESTKILVEACKYYNIKKLIFASSCSVYGANSELTLNEGSFLKPVSLYAKTRVMSEEIILRNSGDVIPVILRMATLFGYSKRMRFDLVANIFSAHAIEKKILTVCGGDQWRPLLHVNDAANAFLKIIETDKEKVKGQIFNAGGNKLNYKIIELAEMIAERSINCKLEIKKDDIDKRDYKVSFDKIRYIAGFIPEKTIVDGFNEIKESLLNKDIEDYTKDIYYNVKYIHK